MDICACVIEKLHISIVFLSSSSFRSLWSSAHGEEKVLPFSYTHHHYYPLSLVYFSFFFISLPRCQEKKTVAHHIDYSELGFFFYLIILCCCCDECVCVGLGEITFIFSEKKISVFIKALGMSLESKNI